MRISRVVLTNWGPFRGDHRIDLERKAYAVIGRRPGDVESSNGTGKSMLAEAVEFALYGEHRYRKEDDFITEGEAACSVCLYLDDGAIVARSRGRGKSTKIQVLVPDGTSWGGDEAQQRIVEMTGLDKDDYRNTAYLAQKQAHRLVTARPEERMSIVSAWLKLDKLEACASVVKTKLSDLLYRRGHLEVLRRSSVEAMAHALGEYSTWELLVEAAKRNDVEIENARAEQAAYGEKLKVLESEKVARERAHEFEQLQVHGKTLRAEREQLDASKLGRTLDTAERDTRMAAGALSEARREVSQKKLLASGRFDGKCPVAGIECPATSVINARANENAQMLKNAEKVAEEAETRVQETSVAARESSTKLREVHALDVRLEALREQARKLKALGADRRPQEGGDVPEDVRARMSALQDRLGALAAEFGGLRRAATDVDRNRKTIENADERLKELDAEIATCRAAIAIFGRNGAQRKVAEGALSHIEVGANALLVECGADLRLALSWAREGGELARHCEECGHPFQKSQKVKECERCRATRGQHVIQKLEVEMSDRSGALDDLGGLVLQMSAWRWLRDARGSAWGVLVLDESVAAFDKSLRRKFTAHLPKMLAATGAEQALIVAHDPSVLDSLPGKIVVTNDGGDAKVEVA